MSAVAVPRLRRRRARSSRRPGLAVLIPAAIVLVFVLCAILAPVLAPHSAENGELTQRLLPPVWVDGGSAEHLLGTDRVGRDVLSRLLHGARVSLLVSIVGILVTGTIGTVVGIVAGYRGGWLDGLLMRTADISLAMPGILIAVLLAAVFGAGFINVVVVVVLLLWPSYARIVRGETLSLRERDYVGLARVAGLPDLRILTRHILPNLMPSILVVSTLQVGHVIVLEASLSFLGVGIPPPTPSWGVMVSDGKGLIETAWWVALLPGAAILLVVLSLNICGDWVRDRLDPRLREL